MHILSVSIHSALRAVKVLSEQDAGGWTCLTAHTQDSRQCHSMAMVLQAQEDQQNIAVWP